MFSIAETCFRNCTYDKNDVRCLKGVIDNIQLLNVFLQFAA